MSSVKQFQALDNLDLSEVAARAQLKLQWETTRLDAAVLSYRQFLASALSGGVDTLVPEADADEIWHLHMLDSQRYTSECREIFGGYLHHIPPAIGSGERCKCGRGW